MKWNYNNLEVIKNKIINLSLTSNNLSTMQLVKKDCNNYDNANKTYFLNQIVDESIPSKYFDAPYSTNINNLYFNNEIDSFFKNLESYQYSQENKFNLDSDFNYKLSDIQNLNLIKYFLMTYNTNEYNKFCYLLNNGFINTNVNRNGNVIGNCYSFNTTKNHLLAICKKDNLQMSSDIIHEFGHSVIEDNVTDFDQESYLLTSKLKEVYPILLSLLLTDNLFMADIIEKDDFDKLKNYLLNSYYGKGKKDKYIYSFLIACYLRDLFYTNNDEFMKYKNILFTECLKNNDCDLLDKLNVSKSIIDSSFWSYVCNDPKKLTR